MKAFVTLAFVAILAGCGADGAPVAPASQAATEPGVTIQGCAKLGVSVGAPTTGGPTRC
ncbi:MAG: argininosuccinate lyase [Pseudorhodobacter sp.]|nr:MAG: argininosuccinate lyase [Pseudorhodobacter sp.]